MASDKNAGALTGSKRPQVALVDVPKYVPAAQNPSTLTGVAPIPKKSRFIKTDKARPLLCTVCTRGFVRQEHLKRHHKAHTNEKPFLCLFCGRCFARRDLVIRHQGKLHAKLIEQQVDITPSLPVELLKKHAKHNTDFIRYTLEGKFTKEYLDDQKQKGIKDEAAPDRYIIKVLGNTETIVPVPLTYCKTWEQFGTNLRQNQDQVGTISAILSAQQNSFLTEPKGLLTTFSIKPSQETPPPPTAAGATDVRSALAAQNGTFSSFQTNPSSSTAPHKKRPKPSKQNNVFSSSPAKRQSSPLTIDTDVPGGGRRRTSFVIVNESVEKDSSTSTTSRPTSSESENTSTKPSNSASPLNEAPTQVQARPVLEPGPAINLMDLLPNENDAPLMFRYFPEHFPETPGNGISVSNGNNFHSFNDGKTSKDIDKEVKSATTQQNHTATSEASNKPVYTDNYGNLVNCNPSTDNKSPTPAVVQARVDTFHKEGISSYSKSSPKKTNNSQDNKNNTSQTRNKKGKAPVMGTFADLTGIKSVPMSKYPVACAPPKEALPNTKVSKAAEKYSGKMSHKEHKGYKNASTSPENLLQNSDAIDDFFNSTNSINGAHDTEPLSYTEMWFHELLSLTDNTINAVIAAQNDTGPDFSTFDNINEGAPRASDDVDDDETEVSVSTSIETTSDQPNIPGYLDYNALRSGDNTSFTLPVQRPMVGNQGQNTLQPRQTNGSETSPQINIQEQLNNVVQTLTKLVENISKMPKEDTIASGEFRIGLQTISENIKPNLDKLLSKAKIYSQHLPKYKNFANIPGFTIINTSLRDFIIKKHNLEQDELPGCQDLNRYLDSYEHKFQVFFSFIHLPSIVPSEENYPLLLSIAAFGAICDGAPSHSITLCKISRACISQQLRATYNNHHLTPTWVVQSLLLHVLINIYTVETDAMQEVGLQLKKVIQLVKVSKMNLPLEVTRRPPTVNTANNGTKSKEQLVYEHKEQFDYFLEAQSRIRICHTLEALSVLFTCILDTDCFLHSRDIKCGIPFIGKELYSCRNAEEWFARIEQLNIFITSSEKLVTLSKGHFGYETYLSYLQTGEPMCVHDFPCSSSTLISLLVAIHEVIIEGRLKTAQGNDRHFAELRWALENQSGIDIMIERWRGLYVAAGGSLTFNVEEMPLLDSFPECTIMIPLYWTARIRNNLDMHDLLTLIRNREWPKLHWLLKELVDDHTVIREATENALQSIEFWARSKKYYSNAIGELIPTPVVTLPSIIITIFVITEFCKKIEEKAKRIKTSKTFTPLDTADQVTWIKCAKVLYKLEKLLVPAGYSVKTYYTFFGLEFRTGMSLLDISMLDIEQINPIRERSLGQKEIFDIICKNCISFRFLYLGSLMINDNPLCQIGSLFAEALKQRGMFCAQQKFNLSQPTEYKPYSELY